MPEKKTTIDIFILIIVFLVSGILGIQDLKEELLSIYSTSKTHNKTSQRGLASGKKRQAYISHVQTKYQSKLDHLRLRKKEFQIAYEQAATDTDKRDVIGYARKYLQRALIDEILPLWLGTRYNFHGTTRTPLEGTIACGYFVSTTLEQVGFNIDRGDLARAPSMHMIQSLASSESRIKIYPSLEPTRKLEAALKTSGEGIYQVGLDHHTGYLIYTQGKVYFFHVARDVVRKEAIHSSLALIWGSKKGMWIGKLLDDSMMHAWLTNQHLPLKTSRNLAFIRIRV